jgi:hypothetical protein
MKVSVYRGEQAEEWDAFVAGARNATFLHSRRFMDYHADRFVDASVLLLDEKLQVLAVCPANREGDTILSHGGLTYGGLLMSVRLTQVQCLEAFSVLGAHYREQGCRRLIYKPVPHIFHSYPAEDDLYALFRVGARLYRRDASTVVSLRDAFSFTKGRKWSVNKGKKAGLSVVRQEDPRAFHGLLAGVLARHQAAPVHSLAELQLLMARFPARIGLYEAVADGDLMAAAMMFDCGNTVHTQYLAASETGREHGALDFLLAELIEKTYADRRYLSFGISTEQAGMVLNEGLIGQKEGFGGRTVVHDFYEWVL